ncbi:MAG: DPP IV N-terminal domain-containing protein [Gemmatimonadota bacterium]|nr:DPP IV N-terminal domain-containing protein [Gemmatimonadota bacterium]
MLAASTPAAAQRGSELTVDAITHGAFTGARLPEPQWLADGSAYLDLRPSPGGGNEIVRMNAATGASTVVATPQMLTSNHTPLTVESIVISRDGAKVLLFHNSVRVWRQNTRGVYDVLDIATGRVTPLSPAPGLQMFAKFAPDGKRVAFVRANNLFVTDLATHEEQALTNDGSDVIINGTSDWVYEEELSIRDAFRWSPDSKRIAFWRFDQSPIPIFLMLDELSEAAKMIPLRYPRAGALNSKVTVGVVDAETRKTTWLHTGDGEYIASLDWAGADSVTVQRMPRTQNRVDVLMLSAASGEGRTMLAERDSAWIDIDEDAPHWLANGTMFLWASERSGWRQYYLYKRDGTLVSRVTRDGVDMTALAGIDEKHGYLYALAAAPTPMQRQLFRYTLRGGAETRVTTEPGTHHILMAPDGGAMVDIASSAQFPGAATLVSLAPKGARHVLEANAELRERLARITRAPEFFQLPLPDGSRLNAMRILPPDFDSTRKYPVLMYVYGGPGSQTVVDDFGGDRYLWHEMLARKGIIVVSVDNHGTGARGAAFRDVVYEHLGIHESDDQIASAKWLATQSWVDPARIGIWGWSYGGYMAAMTSFRGGPLLRGAISVAPVTDWRLYDDIYTERYMRTPAENVVGYDEAAPLKYVSGLTASYLLVYGTGDDNVHPQNSIQLIDKLEAANKQFQLMLYPSRTHSISGGNSRTHLYMLLTNFVMQHLGSAAAVAPPVNP